MPTFECDGCGACCRTYPIFASKTDADLEPRIASEARKLPRSLAQPGWDYQLFPLPFLSACCFLDENDRCAVYAARPQVCRDFAAGGPQCQEARRRAGLTPLPLVTEEAGSRAGGPGR
jgi:Fe-S-cluster containining protein